MELAAFSSTAPGRFVQTEQGATAFVPDPLPRQIRLDNPCIHALARAERTVGQLRETAASPFNPYLITSPMMRREAILSSRMEGTITTPEELLLFEVGASAEGPSKSEDTEEVRNYMLAMNHGLRRLAELPICLRLITEIHATLLSGVRGKQERPGEFRQSQNWIGNHAGAPISEARFVPPPVPEMHECLNDLEQYLNIEGEPEDAAPLLVRLALVHYQFEAIHPFRDGNGRIGRLLVPLMLNANGLLPTPLLYISSFFERHRQQYTDLLLRVSEAGDWTSWIRFFLQGLSEAALESLDQAKRLLQLRDHYRSRFQSKGGSVLLLSMVDYLFGTPVLTINGAAATFGVTKTTASKNIRRLQKEGILGEVSGKARGQVFLAVEIVNFMADRPVDAGTRAEAPTDQR
jgi:Fic family protein